MISSCSSSQSCFFHFVPEHFKINMYSLQANVCKHILVSPQFTAFLELPLCESRTNVRTNFILLINPPTFQPCMQTWCNLFFFFKLDRIQTEERICYQQPKNDSVLFFFFFTHECVKSQKAKQRWESGALERLQAVLYVSHILLSCPLCHESLPVSACKNATE